MNAGGGGGSFEVAVVLEERGEGRNQILADQWQQRIGQDGEFVGRSPGKHRAEQAEFVEPAQRSPPPDLLAADAWFTIMATSPKPPAGLTPV